MIQRLSTTNKSVMQSIARNHDRQARSVAKQSSFTDLFKRAATSANSPKTASNPPAAASSSAPAATSAAATPKASDPRAVPTFESVFGAQPWITNPQGQGLGQVWSYNPMYFATRQTAEIVAKMVGGKVVEKNDILPSGPFTQTQPNQMVELPNGRVINAGLVASFYTHGYSQGYIDRMIEVEIKGGLG
jgi:hypothetical protein